MGGIHRASNVNIRHSTHLAVFQGDDKLFAFEYAIDDWCDIAELDDKQRTCSQRGPCSGASARSFQRQGWAALLGRGLSSAWHVSSLALPKQALKEHESFINEAPWTKNEQQAGAFSLMLGPLPLCSELLSLEKLHVPQVTAAVTFDDRSFTKAKLRHSVESFMACLWGRAAQRYKVLFPGVELESFRNPRTGACRNSSLRVEAWHALSLGVLRKALGPWARHANKILWPSVHATEPRQRSTEAADEVSGHGCHSARKRGAEPASAVEGTKFLGVAAKVPGKGVLSLPAP